MECKEMTDHPLDLRALNHSCTLVRTLQQVYTSPARRRLQPHFQHTGVRQSDKWQVQVRECITAFSLCSFFCSLEMHGHTLH